MRKSFHKRKLLFLSFFCLLVSIIFLFGNYDINTQKLSYTKESFPTHLDLTPDQSFFANPGSNVEYNVYLENTGKSSTNCLINASSNQNYSIEVFWDIDNSGKGDQQLFPSNQSNVELNVGEVATLILRVFIPPTAPAGLVDVTTVYAADLDLGILDFVTLETTIFEELPFQSNLIQIGSDHIGDSNPERTDTLALYYGNNGSSIFFRISQSDFLDPASFSQLVYLDTKNGGEQIGNIQYDFIICSDGILWYWNGVEWEDSGFQTYSSIIGTSILLWIDSENLQLDMQDVNILSFSATKDKALKDQMGPFVILRDNISEVPIFLIPIVIIVLYLLVLLKVKKINYKNIK
jgi:hypothetical protein